MFVYNKTKCTQVIDVPSSMFPVFIHPGMIIDTNVHPKYDKEAFKPFDFKDFQNKELVGILRSYAMGDLIQLIPVVRVFKKHYNVKNIIIYTMGDIANVCRILFSDIIWRAMDSITAHRDCDIVFSLEGTIERDHDLNNPETYKHRLQIYADALGMGPLPSDLDWNPTKGDIKIPSMPTSERKKIALQIRGSGYMKTLKPEVIKKIAHKLAEKHQVFLLDGSADVGFEGENIVNLCGKLNVPQVVFLLKKMDGVMTMDSGMLWLAHAASCPVVTILGPTREKERVSLHPLYPKKAKSINIAEEIIGCKPCFETRTYCGGKINCMNNYDSDILLKKVEEKFNEILEN